MGEEVSETGSQIGYAGANMDLRSRSREARPQAQVRVVEAGGNVPLSRCTGGPRPEEGG